MKRVKFWSRWRLAQVRRRWCVRRLVWTISHLMMSLPTAKIRKVILWLMIMMRRWCWRWVTGGPRTRICVRTNRLSKLRYLILTHVLWWLIRYVCGCRPMRCKWWVVGVVVLSLVCSARRNLVKCLRSWIKRWRVTLVILVPLSSTSLTRLVFRSVGLKWLRLMLTLCKWWWIWCVLFRRLMRPGFICKLVWLMKNVKLFSTFLIRKCRVLFRFNVRVMLGAVTKFRLCACKFNLNCRVLIRCATK